MLNFSELKYSEFKNFAQFVGVGFLMFLCNVAVLYALREFEHVRYYIAVPAAFALGSVIHYFVVRRLIFSGTEREIQRGLLYFLFFAVIDAAIVTVGVTLLVEEGHFNVYIARTYMAAIGGIISYILNARFNFKIL